MKQAHQGSAQFDKSDKTFNTILGYSEKDHPTYYTNSCS